MYGGENQPSLYGHRLPCKFASMISALLDCRRHAILSVGGDSQFLFTPISFTQDAQRNNVEETSVITVCINPTKKGFIAELSDIYRACLLGVNKGFLFESVSEDPL